MEPKQVREAIYAIMRAASDSPRCGNEEAFWEYQRRVMEPLRDDLRNAYSELEQEAA
jgi:hypothetical protein